MIFTPVLVRRPLCPLGLSGPMTTSLLGLMATPNSAIGRYNPSPGAYLPHLPHHLPSPTTHLTPSTYPLPYIATQSVIDITV